MGLTGQGKSGEQAGAVDMRMGGVAPRKVVAADARIRPHSAGQARRGEG
jgi:hypothetical protein